MHFDLYSCGFGVIWGSFGAVQTQANSEAPHQFGPHFMRLFAMMLVRSGTQAKFCSVGRTCLNGG
jgi:hypothetical protein